MPFMTNEQAQVAAQAWHGQAGGRPVLQLTENELAGLVNESIASATTRLLNALDCMDHGCRKPGFQGHENGLGDESAGNELQAAREELERLVGHVKVPEPAYEDCTGLCGRFASNPSITSGVTELNQPDAVCADGMVRRGQ